MTDAGHSRGGGGKGKGEDMLSAEVSWAPKDSQATKDLDGGSCGRGVKWVREETVS